jgi:hypothetical protein
VDSGVKDDCTLVGLVVNEGLVPQRKAGQRLRQEEGEEERNHHAGQWRALMKAAEIDRVRGILARRVLKLTQDAAKARWLAATLLGRRPVKLRKVSFVLHTPDLLYCFGT